MEENKYGAAALSREVAEKYETVNWNGGHRQDFGTFGVVDLSTMTIQQADALVKKGFKKLRLKNTPSVTPIEAEPVKPATRK